ncbi:hypothetical protein RMSM_01409 [Rhodopirellula maiorica SM1]|uniref:Uncharacterized protein n=1 Tax=Rhodopirellula maiorica SM1 TaxID=1265738 RepID=M5S1Y7_9BACT|nr:hypothetical protein RMSM_01409 [Rhodopirellula maiorica SM1]
MVGDFDDRLLTAARPGNTTFVERILDELVLTVPAIFAGVSIAAIRSFDV